VDGGNFASENPAAGPGCGGDAFTISRLYNRWLLGALPLRSVTA
jgi:hypothetical protein